MRDRFRHGRENSAPADSDAPDGAEGADGAAAAGAEPTADGSASTTGTPTTVPKRRRRRLRRLWISLAIIFGLLLAAVAGGAWWARSFTAQLDRNIERFGDPFAPLPADRPTKPAGEAAKALNILLLGSDSRISAGDPSQWVAGAQRTDAIMIMHVDAARTGATIMSIPRDSWVEIPGHGNAKINAAFSWGGPTLMVRTVEKYTHVRIDHVVMIDFEGFKALTDSLGGVTINVAKATHDEAGSFEAGPQRMDGATALRYVRQRHNLPGGDFDRVQRQQNWIRSIMREALAKDSLTDIPTMTDVLSDVTKAIATDEGFSFGQMRDLVWSMRHVHENGVRFFTAPVKGTGWSPDGKQSIVLLDQKKNAGLWAAVVQDNLGGWIRDNDPALLGEVVR
jgi:LCP family protein required for cell wall assembly